ncbi:unnamed protein product [Caretta caretta]
MGANGRGEIYESSFRFKCDTGVRTTSSLGTFVGSGKICCGTGTLRSDTQIQTLNASKGLSKLDWQGSRTIHVLGCTFASDTSFLA